MPQVQLARARARPTCVLVLHVGQALPEVRGLLGQDNASGTALPIGLLKMGKTLGDVLLALT